MMELLMLLFLTQASFVKGAFFLPIAYTFPDGLQSMNGSSSTGGCQPESCVMMPYSGTPINGCDCPGSTPASSVLIDGVIPSINTTQNGTWASELFVVNKDGQDSFMIGFQFSDILLLRHVEIIYLGCPIWGIGSSAVNVYSSFSFPTFSSDTSTKIGMLSLAENTDQSCTSLRTIFIPLQPTISMEIYFIKFTFGGSPARPINWLHLAEIRFSDDVASFTGSNPTTVASAPTTSPTTEIIIIYTSTTTDNGTAAATSVNSTDAELDKTSDYTSVSTSIYVPVPGTSIAAISVPVFVGTLIGVMTLLILLSTAVITILSCAYLKKYKMKQNQAGEDDGYDYVIDRGIGINEARNPIEMKTNEAYGSRRQADSQENTTDHESQAVETHYEEVH